MIMKKLTLCIITTCLLFTTIPTQTKAGTPTTTAKATTNKVNEAANANALLSRLNEIREMDKSNLSSPEKKALRTEVFSIRKHLKDIGGGVYISAGALIVILILLIILL